MPRDVVLLPGPAVGLCVEEDLAILLPFTPRTFDFLVDFSGLLDFIHSLVRLVGLGVLGPRWRSGSNGTVDVTARDSGALGEREM